MDKKKPLYKELPYKYKKKISFINLRGQYKAGKRGPLKEDSFLGVKGINMSYIDLG